MHDVGRGLAIPQLEQRLFDPGWPDDVQASDRRLGPAADIEEIDDVYELTLEVPGLAYGSLRVIVDGRTLRVEGEKAPARDPRRRRACWSERRFGPFARAFTLPREVDAHARAMDYHDGVLRIVMRKRAQEPRGPRDLPSQA